MISKSEKPSWLWFMKSSSMTFGLLVLLLLQQGNNNKFVNACGGFICQPQQPVLQAGENIAFGVRPSSSMPGQVEIDMAVQINYEGPAEDFAWVLPVPTKPCLSTTSDLLFTGLFEATRPTFTFQINNDLSTTCSEEQLNIVGCNTDGAVPAFGSEAGGSGGGAVVLEEGSVGPFDFVILEAAEGRPETVFEWLETNGYDQPDDAMELITYYAGMDMKFVALRLQKDADTGLITPVVLSYDLSADLATNPVACIPIELTRIAAIENMPIQVYLLGPSRGVAYNYAEIDIDFELIDYLSCQQFSFNGRQQQDCYLNSFRSLIDAAAADISGHAFVTEFAHSISSANLQDTIALPVILDNLIGASTPIGFLTILSTIGVPGSPIVQNIIAKYIPHQYKDLSHNRPAPDFCNDENQMPNVYTPDQPWMMTSCLPFLDTTQADGTEYVLNSEALALELDVEVFQPAQQAENWVMSYQYLTRMYAQLDPDQMDKDPLFAFLSNLPDVPREIDAVAVPVCDSTWIIGLDVYANGDVPTTTSSTATISSTRIDASLSCGQWFGPDPFVNDGSSSPALSITSYGLSTDNTTATTTSTSTTRVLIRDPTTGLFAPNELTDLISVLDDKSLMTSSSSPQSLGPSGERCVFDNITSFVDPLEESMDSPDSGSSSLPFFLSGSLVARAVVAAATVLLLSN